MYSYFYALWSKVFLTHFLLEYRVKCIAHESSRREVAEKDRILRRGYKVLHMKSVSPFTKARTIVKENVVTHSWRKNFFSANLRNSFKGTMMEDGWKFMSPIFQMVFTPFF